MEVNNVLILQIAFCVLILFTVVFIIRSFNSHQVNHTIRSRDWEGKVMTVLGLIPADSIGITLPHEHILIEFSKSEMDLTDEATAISELSHYVAAGGKTLTDVTTIGIGRNPDGLKRIATATGINIIMGAGFYKQWWLHRTILKKSVNQLSDIIVNDIINGINGIHAGVIGEIGITKPITKFGKKLLTASAHAQKITGASVILHFDIDDDVNARNYALDIMEKNGADLTRVCISHNTPYVDRVNNFINYAKRGCYVAFDNLGAEVYKPDRESYYSKGKLEPAKTIKALIDKGYLNNILISQDIYVQACYLKNGGYGYAHIIKNILPQFKAHGFTDEQINIIMVENPKRMLSFKNYNNK